MAPADPSLAIVYWNLITPILTPSGNWSDFNGVYRNYLKLIELKTSGLFAGVTIPDPPDPSDYPNLD